MKNNPLTAILLAVLALSAVSSVVLCWFYSQNAREIRILQAQASAVTTRERMLNMLAAETVEYSKTHHDIDSLLESEGLKRPAPSAPAAAPAKPATK
jgi:hypothetical protein